MFWTQTFIPTLKEAPQEAEIDSHKLMLRAGLIQKLGSGLYSFLPLGLRVLKKVIRIITEEMNKKGALELLMPILQPKQIWENSGRWEIMTDVMLKVKDRQKKDFVLGPTHEEIITDIVARRINSYKELPKNFYQIQAKFRDEIRPRFGVIRAKEFFMKDGYSFHVNDACADKTYQEMYDAYHEIFNRCGLHSWPVEADTGVMGGNKSHEFTVLTDIGEDEIVYCENCGYAANRELAVRLPQAKRKNDKNLVLEEVHTPDLRRVEELTSFFKKGPESFIKTLIYEVGTRPVAVLVRGDIEVNENKLMRMLEATDIQLADEKTIEKVTGAPLGFSGPVGLQKIDVVADVSIEDIQDGVTGANKKDYHLLHVNVARDCKILEFHDIGYAKKGDYCSCCGKELSILRGIEVGQVFKLGTKYSSKLGATFLDEGGKERPMVMGCYGIGVSRTIAACIENSHDENGIIWYPEIAPYEVVILPINNAVPEIKKAALELYHELQKNSVDVLLDDRDASPGFKFKDADLIGFPVRVVVSQKGLERGELEVKLRSEKESHLVKVSDVTERILKMLLGLKKKK